MESSSQDPARGRRAILRLIPISRSLREAALRAVDAVWLRQPDALRIRVPAPLRSQIRGDLERSRRLLDGARSSGPGVARDELAAAAVRGFLSVVGRVTDSSIEDTAVAARAGATYVETTLQSDALRTAFAASANFDGRIALDDVGFRRVSYLCEWIEALLDHRSERERRLRRWVPWAILAIVPLVTVRIAFGARNLALGKPVSASSINDRTPNRRYGEDRLNRVVDGVHLEGPALGKNLWRETAFAVSTDVEVHPWVSVDLGVERTLSEAVVYGRSDCCWLSDVPVSIQVSSDNSSFVTVAVRTTPFTAEFPWKASLRGRRARYVRLYAEGADEERIAISELEVYGR